MDSPLLGQSMVRTPTLYEWEEVNESFPSWRHRPEDTDKINYIFLRDNFFDEPANFQLFRKGDSHGEYSPRRSSRAPSQRSHIVFLFASVFFDVCSPFLAPEGERAASALGGF